MIGFAVAIRTFYIIDARKRGVLLRILVNNVVECLSAFFQLCFQYTGALFTGKFVGVAAVSAIIDEFIPVMLDNIHIIHIITLDAELHFIVQLAVSYNMYLYILLLINFLALTFPRLHIAHVEEESVLEIQDGVRERSTKHLYIEGRSTTASGNHDERRDDKKNKGDESEERQEVEVVAILLPKRAEKRVKTVHFDIHYVRKDFDMFQHAIDNSIML